MVRNVSNDPLLLVIHQRQDEMLREAASWRLADAAKHRLDASGQVIKNKKPAIEAAIWRKAAWMMGKAAASLGAWLMAR